MWCARSSLLISLLGASCAHAPAPTRPAEKTLFIESVEIFGGGVWFPAEVRPVADAVAELLARPDFGGYRVIPPAETDALWSSTQTGRLPGVAQRCAVPPPPSALANAIYSGALHADARIDCRRETCTLGIVISRSLPKDDDGGDSEVARFEQPLPVGGSPSAWAVRIKSGSAHRANPPDDGRGGIGVFGMQVGGAAPGVYVDVSDVQLGPGWRDPLDSERLKPWRDAFAACERADQREHDWYLQPLLIEIDPAGQVSRCEFKYPERLPPPQLPCQCEVLRSIGFGRGPVRRAEFNLRVTRVVAPHHSPVEATASLEHVRGSDPTAALGIGFVDESELGECLQRRPSPPLDVEVPVRFIVGADGRAPSHEAKWPPELAVVAGCLDENLARAQFNCPLSGRAIVDARLRLKSRLP